MGASVEIKVAGNDQSKTKRSLMPKWLRQLSGRWLIVVTIIFGLLVAGGVLGYQRYQNLKRENARLANPQESARIEADKLTKLLSAYIELPNETPTVATVVDADKLKAQAFFANAQNGDKVLIYAQAKKAILYRPSTNKIIEVAPLNIGNNQVDTSSQPTTTPSEQPKTTPTNSRTTR